MSALSTPVRILDSAEQLFAEQGIASTTLRQITAAASVNLAAVNYHFGNKQSLVHEVFRRRLDRLASERMARLSGLMALDDLPDLKDVLQALIEPALEISQDKDRGGLQFMKVVARAYAENDAELHGFLSAHYGHVIREFAQVLRTIMPGTPDADLRWQLDFVVGALTYIMADFGSHLSAAQESDPRAVAQRLVLFATAGFSALTKAGADPIPNQPAALAATSR